MEETAVGRGKGGIQRERGGTAGSPFFGSLAMGFVEAEGGRGAFFTFSGRAGRARLGCSGQRRTPPLSRMLAHYAHPSSVWRIWLLSTAEHA